jgi:hypothetical protein
MSYSLEYKTWTGEDVEALFEMEDESLLPGESDDIVCEGIGNLGRYKDLDGNLMLKMPSTNDDGYEMIPYLLVRSRFTYLQFYPKSL